MTFYAFVAVSLLYCSVAQVVTPDRQTLAEARQYFNEGRLVEAVAKLRTVGPSADRARLQAEIAIARDDVPDAIEAYEQLQGTFRTPAPEILRAIAGAKARSLRTDADPLVRVTACEALLHVAAHAECITELNRVASDGTADATTRFAAARALYERNAPNAARLLELVISAAISASPSVAAEGLAGLPQTVSNEPLKQLAMSENRDARYVATLALARRRTADMLPLLRTTASDPEAGAARLVAYIGLAASGDPEALKILRETLPLITGRERLEAALALVAIRDPQGPPMLEGILKGEHEMLRIDAAEVLYPTHRSLATPVIVASMASANPWVRARAFQAMASLSVPTTPALRRSMADRNAWVASAATRAVLQEVVRR